MSAASGLGSTFNLEPWFGGVNDLLVSDHCLTSVQAAEFFQSGDEYPNLELYDDIVGYCPLGEDTYPAVEDVLGNITGGTLENGTADDFVDMPEPPSEE